MKYLITENKLNNIIERFIRDKFPNVFKVYFTTHRVGLGSTKGTPIIERTKINIIIDNSENKLKKFEIKDMSRDIKMTINDYFNLGIYEYGSEWTIDIVQLAVVGLDSELSMSK